MKEAGIQINGQRRCDQRDAATVHSVQTGNCYFRIPPLQSPITLKERSLKPNTYEHRCKLHPEGLRLHWQQAIVDFQVLSKHPPKRTGHPLQGTGILEGVKRENESFVSSTRHRLQML